MAQSKASLIADPGAVISIPAQSHTFVKIDHKIFSTVILLLPLIQERRESVISEICARSTGLPLSRACPVKSVVSLTDHLDMSSADDWDLKPRTEQN